MNSVYLICVWVVICSDSVKARLFIVPEDIAMIFTTIYGFAPPIRTGNDHRIGFGYRFGNHADVQVLFELGPQIATKPLDVVSVPPLSARQVRRPLLNLLLRSGLIKDASYGYKVVHNKS